MPTPKPPQAPDLAAELSETAKAADALAVRVEQRTRLIRAGLVRPRRWEMAGDAADALLSDACELAALMAVADTLRRLQGKG